MPAAWPGPRYTIDQLISTENKCGSVEVKVLADPLSYMIIAGRAVYIAKESDIMIGDSQRCHTWHTF